MKLLIFFAVIAALAASSLGLKNEICGQPHSVDGICLAIFPSYSYNAAGNECVSFVYGGCGGNDNRFLTQEECEQKCKE
ncbi:hypothetical protein KR018_010047 [Drosophila ironensis]|nr:hypothetical protein KR018_010047 [Drosophila ironensis]